MKPLTVSKLSELSQAIPIPQTLANIIAAVMADQDLKPTRRRDLVSSIKRFCGWRHLDPALIPASSRIVVAHFKEIRPNLVGKSAKTVANVRADIQFALGRYVEFEPPSRGKGLTPEWEALQEPLVDRDVRYRLSRLVGYCSKRGIAPHMVDDAVTEQFRAWLSASTLIEHPDSTFRYALLAWNKAVATIPGWPCKTLSVPSNRTTYCLPWNELPEPFVRDAEAWLARSANPDPFDDDAPLRPWKEETLNGRRFALRQLASALHHRGYDMNRLHGLADLVELDTAKTALAFFYDAEKGTTSRQIAGLAHVLCTIAEHWVKVDERHLAALKRIKAQIESRREHKGSGMTPKNRDRLRQLAQRDNLIAFLGLPQKLLSRTRDKKRLSLADALDMQVAFAIELLLMAPIRRRSLVSIELDKHLLTVGKGRSQQRYLCLPDHIVKNEIDLDFSLPPESFPLIDCYVNRCLPLLRKHGGMWLFPGDIPGTHKHRDQFSRQFTKTIRRYTGLTVNLHLMRHLGAKLYLDRNPGAYEVMRRVLGHKRMSTTVDNYTGLETELALRHFDAVILGIRKELLQGDSDA